MPDSIGFSATVVAATAAILAAKKPREPSNIVRCRAFSVGSRYAVESLKPRSVDPWGLVELIQKRLVVALNFEGMANSYKASCFEALERLRVASDGITSEENFIVARCSKSEDPRATLIDTRRRMRDAAIKCCEAQSLEYITAPTVSITSGVLVVKTHPIHDQALRRYFNDAAVRFYDRVKIVHTPCSPGIAMWQQSIQRMSTTEQQIKQTAQSEAAHHSYNGQFCQDLIALDVDLSQHPDLTGATQHAGDWRAMLAAALK